MNKLRIYISLVLIFILIFQAGASTAAVTIYNDYAHDTNLAVENDNLPPVADFSFTKKQKVDIVIVFDSYLPYNDYIKYKIDYTLNPIFSDKSIDANYNLISSDSSLDSILPTLTWRDGAERYYINITYGMYPELSDNIKLADVLSYLGNKGITFIGMGNPLNQPVIEKLISNNSGKGLFISNSNIDTAFTRLGNYIAGNVNIDLFFNVGLGPVTADIVKDKYESIVKPKLVANDISVNVNINTSTYNSVAGAKIAPAPRVYESYCNFPIVLKPDGTLWNLSTGARIPGENGVGYLDNIVDITISDSYYWAVDAKGYVYKWNNDPRPYGSCILYPQRLPGGETGQTYMTNVVKVAVSNDAVYVLRKDGTVWYFGSMSIVVGDEDDETAYVWSKPVFTQVKLENGNTLTNITQIAAGGRGGLALDSGGNMYLLSGTFTSSPYKLHTDAKLVATQVEKIAVGSQNGGYSTHFTETGKYDTISPISHFVYLKTDGSVWRLAKYNSDEKYDGIGNYIPGGEKPYRFYKNTKSPIDTIFALEKQVQILRDDSTLERIFNQYDFNNIGRYGSYGITTGDIYTMCGGDINVNDNFYFIKNNGEVWSQYRHDTATFTGFNASVSGAYPYNDVLSSAPFKDVNDQYFVELSNTVLPELSDSTALSKITTTLNSGNIRTVGIGSSANAAQLQYLNTLNGGKGAYFDISNIDAAMNSLADYIISNSMRPPRLINDYFLVSDEIDPPTTFYSDIESDPYNSRWVYEHNPYNFLDNTGAAMPFDNPTGYFSLDRKVLSEPVTSFVDTDNFGGKIEKVGGYKVKYQVQDNPKAGNSNFANYNRDSNIVTKYLNLHRKPIANYTVNATDDGTKYNITINDNGMSYDLDHTSRSDKGIAKRLWGIATFSTDGKLSWQYSKGNDLTKTYKVPKGGRYVVSLSVQDIDGPYGLGAWSDPVMVGIPGRPVALFDISPNPLPVSKNATVTDLSYAAMPGYTITQRKWNIKKVGNSSFSYVNQPTCKANYADSGVGNYEITLEVMDSGGVWSLPFTKTLTVIDTIPPQISAVPSSRTWSNNNVSVTLACHDDGGSGLKRVDYIWTLNPSDVSAYSSANISGNDYNYQTVQSANGKWYLCARVMDNSDNYSNNGSFEVFGTYNIDKIAPTVSSSLDTGIYQDSVAAAIIAADKGGSGIRTIRYKWTSSTAKPASGWTSANIDYPEDKSESITSTINQEGTWYLHMQVNDYAGNSAYKCSRPVIIQNLSITDITIEGYWNHWRGQVDMLGKRLTNEPHRFLSLECVRINISTTGDPERVTVRFSPELEAMEFTDPNGHIYNYSDYFGREISFPEASTFTASGNNFYWEYNLPLAPSSKDWNDNRLRPQYSLTVTAYKGGRSVTRTVDDIDITGNIYDLTYIQPRD